MGKAAKSSQAQSSVAERRLRPIYGKLKVHNWLNHGASEKILLISRLAGQWQQQESVTRSRESLEKATGFPLLPSAQSSCTDPAQP